MASRWFARAARVFLFCTVITSALPSSAARIVNGAFNTLDGTTGWNPAGRTWSSNDSAGNGSSGSLEATNSSTSAGTATEVSFQCVDFESGISGFHLGGKIFIPPSQTATGNAFYDVSWNDSVACAGAQISSTSTPAVATAGTWTSSDMVRITRPPAAVSARIRMFIVKNEASGTLTANFDNVYFTAADVHWTSLVSGNFSVASNWSDGNESRVPTANDNAIIAAVGTYTVTLDSTATVNRLTVGIGALVDSLTLQTLAVPGGTALTATNGGNITGKGIVTISGGTLALNGASSMLGALTLTSGSLTGSGTITSSGTVAWQGGTLDGTGLFDLTGGTLSIESAATKSLMKPVRTGTAVTTTWSAGAINSGNGSVFTNNGTLNVTGDGTWAYNLGGALPRIDNAGTVTKSSGTGITNLNVAFNQTAGSVGATSGELQLSNGGTSTGGSFSPTSPAVLAFSSGTHSLGALTTVSGSGTVRAISSGIVNLAGTYSVTGTTGIAGGTMNFNAPSMTTSNLAISSGLLGGSGDLTTTTATWTGGQIDGAGTLTIADNFALSGATKSFTFRTITANGPTSWDGSPINSGSGAVFRNNNIFTITGDGTWSYNLGGALPRIDNAGTVVKNSGAGVANLNVAFNQTAGSVGATSGELHLSNGGSSTGGSFTATLPGVLAFSSGTHSLSAGTTVSGSGTVRAISGGIANLAGAHSVTGTTDIAGGTMNFNAPSMTTSNLAISSGLLGGGGNLTATTATWTGGQIDGAGTLTVSGNFSLAGTTKNFTFRTINANGPTSWDGSPINSGSGATFVNNNTFTITGDGSWAHNLGGALPRIDNTATVVKSGGTGITNLNVAFNQTAGSVGATSGELQLSNGGTSTGGSFSPTSPAVLAFSSGTHSLGALTTVSGSGTVRAISGGIVNLAGTYSVTGTTGIAGGTMNFNAPSMTTSNLEISSGLLGGSGNLTATTATWTGGQIDGAGTLTVSGNFSLAGTTKNFTFRTITANGSTSWDGSPINSGSGATFVNNNTFTITGDGSWAHNLGGALPRIDNTATVVKSGGTGITNLNVAFNQTAGSVGATAGELQLSNGGTSTGGSFNPTSPAVLAFSSGTHSLSAATSVSGSGTVRAISGGIVNLAGTYSVTGTTGIAGGTMNFNAPSMTTSNLAISSGLLGGSGDLTTTTATWTGGQIDGATSAPFGTLTVSDNFSLAGTTKNFTFRTINANGPTSWDGSAINSGSGAVFRNNNTFTITGDGSWAHNLGGALPRIDNTAAVVKSGGTGITNLNVAFNQTAGSVGATSGELQLSNGGTSTGGSFSPTSPAVLAFSSGTHSLSAATSVSGSGTVRAISGGIVNLAGTYSVTGTTGIAGGTMNFNAPSMTTSNLAISSGLLGGSGDLTTTTATWTEGQIDGATSAPFGTLTVSGNFSLAGASKNFTFRTINANGPTSWDGSTINSGSGAVFRNNNTFTITGDGTWAHNLGGALPRIDNTATVVKSGGTGITNLNVAFNQTAGSVGATSGELHLTNGSTNTGGSFTATSPAVLAFSSGTHSLSAATSVSGSGTIRAISGGIVNLAGTYSVTGTTGIAGGTMNFNAPSMTTSNLAISSGFLGGSGDLTTTTATWTGGQIDGATSAPFGTLTVSGNFSLAGASKNFTFRTINANGPTSWDGSAINSGSGATFINNGTFTITGDGTWAHNLGGSPPVVNNSGTFAKTAGTGTTTIAATLNQTAGTLSVDSGTFGWTAVSLNGGLLRGSATLAAPVTNNGGTVAPGLSPGILTISGNYTQGSSGTLALEIGGTTAGTQHDRLVVTGTATLGGTFSTTSFGGFVPPLGSTYSVLACGTCSGSFSNASSTAGSSTLSPTYNATSTVLTATAVSGDLAITKTNSVTNVSPGATLSYTIVASNPGSVDATGATVTDTPPAAFSSFSWTCTASGTATCGAASGTGPINQTINLPAGTSVTYAASGTISAAATGTVSNTATITPPTGFTDTNAANNSATETDNIAAIIDLRITLTDSDPVVVSTQYSYGVTLANLGPASATNVTASFQLPSGSVFVSATSTQGSCSLSTTVTGLVECTSIGTIASGGNVSMTITVNAPSSPGTATLTANASATEPDSSSANNTNVQETTTIVAAAVFVVNQTADVVDANVGDGVCDTDPITAGSQCSLRAAIQESDNAPGTNTIQIAAGTYILSVGASNDSLTSSGDLDIVDSVKIVGAGATSTIIDGGALDRIFDMSGVAVSIAGVTLRNGAAGTGSGGLLRALDSSVDILDSHLASSTAAAGGAIFNQNSNSLVAKQHAMIAATVQALALSPGTLVLDRVAITGCSATSGAGGGINNFDGNVSVINSTLSGNAASSSGGAISHAAPSTGSFAIRSATIGFNTATTGGGIHSAGAAYTIESTILQGNSGGNCSASIVSSGHNMSSDTSCAFSATGDQASVSAQLQPIAGNGGPTPTHAISSTSPAIDAGPTTTSLTTDQRGFARSTDGDGNGFARVDIGAFEAASLLAADLSITKTASSSSVLLGQNIVYSLSVSNAGPSTANSVTISDTLPAGTTFISTSSSQGSCSHSSGIVTCAIGSLGIGSSASATITVSTTTTGSKTNTATVSATEADTNSSNNSASVTTTVAAASADLAITKGASASSTFLAQNITYSLGVSNSGPQPATNVTIIDTLPTGTTFVSASSSQGSCTQASGVVTCVLGSIAVGGTASASIIVTAATTGSKTNTASVSASEGDPNSANNTATVTTTVNPSADLSVTKTDSPDPVTVGSNVTYSIGVANNGPSTATNVVVTDTIPSASTFVSASTTQGSCSQSGGILTCSIGTLSSGANAVVSMIVTTTGTGTLTNTATATATESDPNTTNNSATATTAVNAASSDLAITKAASATSVLLGQNITYSLGVSNAGPQNATNVTVTDTLPAGTTFVSASSSQATCNQASGVVTCSLGSLAVSANATMSIVVTASTSGTKTNTASVSAAEGDPIGTNNSASATTTVTAASANLAITKTASATSVLLGQNITYSLGVSNAGPQTATNVTVTDTLPAGTTFVSASSSQGTCSQVSGVVTCPLGSLAVSANATVSIVVTASTSGTKTNTASVSAAEGDPNGTNNSASATTTVTAASADLAITKAASATSVLLGQNITYSLGVSNAGPQTATNVTVTDTLPAGTTFVSASSSQGTCSQASGVVTCSLGSLAASANATMSIVVTASTSGTKTNTASVSASESDPNPANNSASATTTAGSPSADMKIVKSGPSTAEPNTSITYTITVRNEATAQSATNVVVTDVLPLRTSFVSVSTTQGSCSSGATVTCSIGTVAPGGGATISLVVRIAATATSVTNTASVSATEPDPATANNSSSVTTSVTARCQNAAPSLLAPSDGATNVSSPATLSFGRVEGATGYRVFASINSGAFDRIADLPATTTAVSLAFPSGASVQWFVEAYGFTGGCPATVSRTFSFTAARCELPTAVITAPAEGATNVPSPVTIRWEPVTGATSYRVTLTDAGAVPQTRVTSETSITFEVAPGTATVSVVALNTNGCESAASTRRFGSTNCTIPERGPTPAAPGEVTTGVEYEISWTPVSGASRYEIQESVATTDPSSTPDFASGVTRNIEQLSTKFTHTVGSDDRPIAYFYRIRARIGCNNAFTPYSRTIKVVILPKPKQNDKNDDLVTPFDPNALKTLTTIVTFCANAAGVLIDCPSNRNATTSAVVTGSNTTATVTTSTSWLTVSPPTVTVPPGGSASVTVTANTGGLPVGTSTGSVTATTSSGQKTSTPVSISLVTPVSPSTRSEPTANTMIIPAVAHVDGIGSLWQSDVRITNTASQNVTYRLTFVQSGADATQDAKSTELEIRAGQTTALDDIIKRWYGQGSLGDGANGTLEIRPLDFLGKIGADGLSFATVASSRSYAKTTNGTLGQFVPAIPFVSFVGKQQPNARPQTLSVQQIVQNGSYRTNLGLVEGSGREANVEVTVFSAKGDRITSFTQLLKPGEHRQLNSFLAARGITLDNGRVEVKVLSDAGKVISYASVVDSRTNDPLLVPASQIESIQSSKYVLPGVSDVRNGSASWQTDMRLFNPSIAPVTALLELFEESSSVPRQLSIDILPGEVRAIDNVVRSAFGRENVGGAVHISTPTLSSLVITGRTYDQRPEGTFGQFIQAVTIADAVGRGDRTLQVQQLEESSSFRTNLGIAELTGKPVTVEITAIVPDSLVAPRREITLQGNQFTQINRVLSSMNLTDVYNARISLRVIGGDGKITAYGSVVDNKTQDPTYVPAQ